MTIALLLSCTERGGSPGSQSTSLPSHENGDTSEISDQSPTPSKKAAKFPGLEKFLKKKLTLKSGGNLIVCPMTLLGQWKVHLFCFKYASRNGWFFRIYNDCNLVTH